MKKAVLFAVLFPGIVLAAPFLTCDVYPETVIQPTDFVVSISGIVVPIVTPAVSVPGGKTMMLDLGPLNITGPRTITAKARNPAYGDSASTDPHFLYRWSYSDSQWSYTIGPIIRVPK